MTTAKFDNMTVFESLEAALKVTCAHDWHVCVCDDCQIDRIQAVEAMCDAILAEPKVYKNVMWEVSNQDVTANIRKWAMS